MAVGPPLTPARPRRSAAVAVAWAAIVLIAVVVGVIVTVHIASGSESPELPGLRRVLDAAPLPAGVTELGETESDGHGDTTPAIERRYRLTSATAPTDEIEQVLVAAHYRVLDLPTGNLADVPGGSWTTSVSPAAGDVTVLPPGRTGGGIEYLWKGDRLWVTVRGGALDD